MAQPDPNLQALRRALQRDTRHLAGHGPQHPANELERVAKIIRDQDLTPDVYGTGTYLADFEAEVAVLLGKAAARFMPSGCMAQPIALRIWSDERGLCDVAFHGTSHLELHEEQGYQALHGLRAHLLGDLDRPTLARDLDGLPPISALLVELPAREIGGQLPSWAQLVNLSERARMASIRLHLDGARLWQAHAAYGRSLAEICALFDSVYVSFYKGIGALPGAMLLGPTDFIDKAAVWQRRQGGTLYSALPNIVSARTRLAPQIAKMAGYRAMALEVAALWTAHVGASALPNPPQTSMFHLTLSGEIDALLRARDAVAQSHGVWLFGGLRAVEGGGRTELSMGDGAATLTASERSAAIDAFFAVVRGK